MLHSLFIMILLLCLLCSGSTLYTHDTEQTAEIAKYHDCFQEYLFGESYRQVLEQAIDYKKCLEEIFGGE